MSSRPAGNTTHEDGFTLVEMVVSMVLLGILAAAFLPMVTQAMYGAASSSALATATRLVSDQLESVRATPLTSCPTTSSDPSGTVVATTPALNGVQLETRTRYEGTCTDPGIVRYVVWVTRADAPTVPVATTTTFVMVGNA